MNGGEGDTPTKNRLADFWDEISICKGTITRDLFIPISMTKIKKAAATDG